MDLYTKKIIELAAKIPFSERLLNPDVSTTKRTPICSSRITIDITLSTGKISKFGQKINACALGQASTTIVTRKIIGRSKVEIEELLVAVENMLTTNGPIPKSPFSDYKALSPAKDYKNRHASILLPFEATLAAFQKIEEKK